MVADEHVFIFVEDQANVAALAFQNISAVATLDVCRRAPAVQKQDHLLMFVQGIVYRPRRHRQFRLFSRGETPRSVDRPWAETSGVRVRHNVVAFGADVLRTAQDSQNLEQARARSST